MAEGWARELATDLPPFLALEFQSAGLEAHGLNQGAVAVMAENRVDISNQQSTLLTDRMLDDADVVITVCSHADHSCPEVPPGKRKVHLPFDDPAAATGSEQEIHAEFFRICGEIRQAVAKLLQQILLDYLEQARGNVYGQSDMEIVTRESAYSGFIPVDVIHLRHRLFAGGWSETMRRELAIRPAAVGVLLYDPTHQNLIMVKQFRTGIIGADQSPWMLEIVAGLAGPDEEPFDVARREALEEANCDIVEAVPICEYYNSPGWCNERINLYCAVVDSEVLQGIHGLDDEHEDILIVTVPLKDVTEMIQTGEINNAMSIIAIQWLQLNLHRFHNN